MADRRLIIPTFVELADTLVKGSDLLDLFGLLTDRCVEVLGVAGAGLMLGREDGELRVVTASSETMRILELYELQAQQGPCPDCYRSGEPVLGQVLAEATGRWPLFAPKALSAGFHTVEALPMRSHGLTLGALNIFHTEGTGLTGEDLEAAQAMADIATIAILQTRLSQDARILNEQLQEALDSRVVIEQAKGALAAREQIDVDSAFAAMRQHARERSIPLLSVARELLEGTIEVPLRKR